MYLSTRIWKKYRDFTINKLKNATVDWSKRSDVRAKLRLTVRKILIKYGYPPDLARMEADRVIEQSELLVESFTN